MTFNNTDGTTTTTEVSFNPYVTNWQYAATGTAAEKAYSSIKIELAYDYNANKAWFDGIQLYREAFGNAYTYYNTGRVKTATDVQGQETTYSYNSAGDLTTVNLPSGEKVTYTYDSYHNVKSATTAEGIKYTYTYDTYGNNLSVSIGSTITSYATYTSDGNRLATTKDAAGKITTYQYNADTNVLEWVQYPEDTSSTRTNYTYDAMYRLSAAAATTDGGLALSASYTYAEDMLTSITTPSTTYSFVYGNFGLRSNVQVGSQSLAKYYYESGTNRLIELEYGNSDVVQYTYNTQGWLTKQTYYEDGSTTVVDATVTYLYDNDGALASVIDSASGITTKYFYDFAGRLVKYTENNDTSSAIDSNDHSVAYTYDDKSQVTRRKSTALGSTWTMAYVYDEDGRITSATQGTVIRNFTYDTKNRLTGMTLVRDSATALTTTYAYKANTGMVSTITMTNKAGETGKFQYSYDNNGNISSVATTTGGVTKTTQYVYDTAGQLVRENNARDNTTTVWTYDNAGNILSEKVYVYTTGTPSELLETNTYSYTSTQWGDLLTAYNGNMIYYDGYTTLGSFKVGNPTTYDNGTDWTFTWEHGRQLATMKTGSTTWTNTYNSAGLRTSRTDGTTTYTYYYEEGRLSAIKRNDLNMWIIYDENGPVTLKYGSGTFHYVTNLQGDVVAIVGNQGQTLVEYTYDAWGKVISITGDYAYNLGIHNPILYRGYIYDHETGFYYCQSRFYDPETGRFLNADAFTTTGQGILGNNMFIYCRNNPVNYLDLSGYDTVAIQEAQAWWISVMSWLCAIDGVIPVGDIIYIGGILILGAVVLSASEDTLPETSFEEEDNQPETEPEPPDVTYPGDDPGKAPDGYEWRGPDPQGGERGGYANPNGKDSFHPDLNHPDGIAPHWDYNDGYGHKWRIYPTWIEFVK